MKTKLLLFLILIASLSWGQTCPVNDTFNSATLSNFVKSGYVSYESSVIRLASGNANGVLTANANLLQNVSGTVNIQISASGWDNDELTFQVNLGNETQIVNLNNFGSSNLEDVNLTFMNVPSNPSLVITALKNIRIFIKSVKVCYTNCTPPTFTGTLTAANLCGSTDISYVGNDTNLYWQTTATGTDQTVPYSGVRNVTTAGTYYLRKFEGNCWSTAISIPVTIYAVPTLSGNLSVNPINCSSSEIKYSATSDNGLYWQTTANGESLAEPYNNLTVTTTGTYYLRRVVNGCWSDAKQINVTGFDANTISTQPQDVSATVGSTATFSVVSNYAGVSYQWETFNGTSWQVIPGANAATYSVTNAQLNDSGKQFRVLVTDACGTLTSNVANLSVVTGPCYAVDFNDITSGNSNSTSGSGTALNSYAGFSNLTRVYNAGGAIRLGSGSDIGSITSEPLNIAPGNISVEISAKGWGASERTVYISVNDEEREFLIPTFIGGAFSTAVFTFSNVSANSILKIYTKTSAERAIIDDIKIYCNVVLCQTPNITNVYPLSGPAGTVVTITSADDLSNQAVYFGNIAAQIVSQTASQLQFIVPAGVEATTFNVYEDANCVATENFTITNTIGNDCYNGSGNQIFISEVYDAESGSLGYLEVYNPTNLPIDLSNYKIRRYGDVNDLTSFSEESLSGIIQPNSALVFKINTSGGGNVCNVDPLIQVNLSGINEDDLIELYFGTSLIDSVITPSERGYTLLRKPTAISPSDTYNENDWNISSSESCTNLGTHQYGILTNSLNHNINLNYTCGSNQASVAANVTTSANVTVTAYQWFVNVPNTTTWVALTNNSEYAGATTNVLNILSTTGKNGYQYYCEISTANVTCKNITQAVTLSDSTATIWDGNAWSNGNPTIGMSAIINANYNTLLNGSFTCCSLTVNSNYTLTIDPNTFVEVVNDITNNGILKVENQGQLVQINDLAVNTGNIILDKKVMLKRNEYSQYTTPVQTANIFDLSPNTLRNKIWEWVPTINGNYGNWIRPAGAMEIAKGYVLTAPNNFSSTTAQEFLTTFNGVPNNGVVNYQVSRGNYTGADYLNPINNIYVTKWDDNFSLIGNPYPSSISANDFIIANQAVIEGSIEIWVPSPLSASNPDPFYGNYDTNYDGTSFIVYNLTGQTSPGNIDFNGYIASAQAFFVTMQDGTQANGNIFFNNAMRSKGENNVFYRHTNTESKFWLSLNKVNANTTNIIKRILVGYVNGATNSIDNLYDAVNVKTLTNDIYSLQNNTTEGYIIQGKQLPFNVNDVVPLGINIESNGTFEIKLDKLIGELDTTNQNIYLEDRHLGFEHNLKNGPYSFTATKGRYEDRFVIKYVDRRLSLQDINVANEIIVFGKDALTIQSSTQNIKKVQIFDTLGRLLDVKEVNDRQIEFTTLQKNNAGLILNIELENGTKVSKKYIY